MTQTLYILFYTLLLLFVGATTLGALPSDPSSSLLKSSNPSLATSIPESPNSTPDDNLPSIANTSLDPTLSTTHNHDPRPIRFLHSRFTDMDNYCVPKQYGQITCHTDKTSLMYCYASGRKRDIKICRSLRGREKGGTCEGRWRKLRGVQYLEGFC